MPVLSRALSRDEVDLARRPRDDVVVEVAAGPERFTAIMGPFARYERRLTPTGHHEVIETIDYRLAPMVWPFPFAGLYRKALLQRRADGGKPWWSPPETPDARAATALGCVCALALVLGYIGVLLSQTITFAADELSASKTDQGATLAAVRIGVLGALALTALADRTGRRRVLLGCAGLGCVIAALSGLAPNLVSLGAAQTVVRGLATAGSVLVVIVAAEEVPAGSRAFAISLIGAAGAFGAGWCLMLLPLADTSDRGWRLVFGASVLLLPIVRLAARHLPESRRYDITHAEAGMAGHGRRFWLLAISALLLSLFTAPASQLLNEFLRDEEGFSAARITMFSILTNTPGGIGLFVGGRLADTRGRRIVGAGWRARGHRAHRGHGGARGLADVGAVGRRGRARCDGGARPERLRARAVPHLVARTGERHHRHPRGDGQRDRAHGGRLPLRAVGWAGPCARAALDRAASHGRPRAGGLPRDRAPGDRGAQPRGPDHPDADGADRGRHRATTTLTAVPVPWRRRLLVLVAVVILTATACTGQRPRLAEDAEVTTTSTTAPQTTTTEPAPVAQVAQAKEQSVDVFASQDAEEADRQIVSGVDTSVDTIPVVFLVKQPGDERLEVYLPVRPNGSRGWVNAEDVTVTTVSYRIEIALSEHRIQVYDGEDVIVDEPVGVGRTDRPTPGGIYYLKELLQPPDPNSVYGSFAYGLSGFSNVLQSFNGGPGVIGIHGTNDPSSIGSEVSSGCIRMQNDVIERLVYEIGLPLGTPVEILP